MDVLLQPTEQTRSHRKAEVVNELLWVAAKRTFTSPGPWPLVRSCATPADPAGRPAAPGKPFWGPFIYRWHFGRLGTVVRECNRP